MKLIILFCTLSLFFPLPSEHLSPFPTLDTKGLMAGLFPPEVNSAHKDTCVARNLCKMQRSENRSKHVPKQWGVNS